MSPEANPTPDCASLTVEELISQLRSSFFSHEFQHVAKILIQRQQHLYDQYLMMKTKAEEEKKGKELLLSENLKVKDDSKKKDNEIEAMKKVISELERKIRVYDHKISTLGRISKEPGSPSINLENKEQKGCTAELTKQAYFSQKEDSKKQTENNIHDVFVIDDDDDDDHKHISTLKRKRASNVIKREYSIEKEDSKKKTEPKLHGIFLIIDDEDDDDNKCKSSLKENQVLNEIKREHKADEDLEFFSTSKRKRVSSEMIREKSELDGSGFDSGSDSEKVNKLYMLSCSKMKKQRERWTLESDMVKEFEKDDDLCMNGVCALYRHKFYAHGSDITSFSDLARKLIDGDSENKLQKKASELNDDDLGLCRMLTKKYSSKLFNIYMEKSDPFFPTTR